MTESYRPLTVRLGGSRKRARDIYKAQAGLDTRDAGRLYLLCVSSMNIY